MGHESVRLTRPHRTNRNKYDSVTKFLHLKQQKGLEGFSFSPKSIGKG